MGKRVLQADGTYCYTDNCRIHDRNPEPVVGAAAIIRDSERNRYITIADDIAAYIKSETPELKNQAKNLGNELVDYIYNNSGVTAADLATHLYNMVYGDLEQQIDGNQFDRKKYEKLYQVGQLVYHGTFHNLVVKEGDEVVIKSTGQRGTVSEGSTFGNGRVRINTENGLSFNWYTHKEVEKILPNPKGLAREQIISAPRDAVFPSKLFGKLLEQETDVATRNPQGLYGLSNEEALAVREEIVDDLAKRWVKGMSGKEVTKFRFSRFLQEEIDKQRSWLSDEDRANVRQALKNIKDYIDPEG